MNIPFSRWYPAIARRTSRRSFDATRIIEPGILAALENVCRTFTPFHGARSYLVNAPRVDVFRGFLGGYGKIKQAPAFIAFVGDVRSPNVQETIGYTGEGIILEATALGLDTCWVGGLFSRATVARLLKIQPHERVLAVTPVGYARHQQTLEEQTLTNYGRHRQRLSLAKLIRSPAPETLPTWMQAALESARIAPSAMNRQPWGFEVLDNEITVYLRSFEPQWTVSKRLDCGIAMLHLEVAAGYHGITGKWQLLPSPQVARFSVE